MTSPWAYRQMRSQPRLPFPGQRALQSPQLDERCINSPELISSTVGQSANVPPKEEILKHLAYLYALDSTVFEQYILENVRLETLQKVCAKKKSLLQHEIFESDTSKSLGDISEEPTPYTTKVLQKEIDAIQTNNQLQSIEITDGNYLYPLYLLCGQLQIATLSTGFTLYAVGGSGDTIHLYNPELPEWKDNPPPQNRASILPSYQIGKHGTVASHVAVTRQPVVVHDVNMDDRFPKGTSS
uniref:Uncharacterized protein n=1 Tax=Ciona savignyi TaxID=51511 RepID=H2Y6F1_CIOSA